MGLHNDGKASTEILTKYHALQRARTPKIYPLIYSPIFGLRSPIPPQIYPQIYSPRTAWTYRSTDSGEVRSRQSAFCRTPK